MFDVVALGELLIDFTYAGVSASGNGLFEQNPGGAPANVLAACAALGMRTAFIGKVGADMHGRLLKETLAARGIDVSNLIEDPDTFTTLAFVKLTDAERSFSFARKPGADTRLDASELDVSILEGTRVFHFGSISLTDEPVRSATMRALEIAKGAGALISYDPNYRASLWECEEVAIRRMRSVLPLVDLIKISDEETALLTGETDPEKAADVLLGQGIKCAVVTLGSSGALAKTARGSVQIPACACVPVDTTGAGDCFWGSFLYALLQ
ncbi:MAG: carbohydrate kinase, partial [Oscillospiraceae bacterium]|nr:carbohydrate kinase [Oscillospiraceae bacterium]